MEGITKAQARGENEKEKKRQTEMETEREEGKICRRKKTEVRTARDGQKKEG